MQRSCVGSDCPDVSVPSGRSCAAVPSSGQDRSGEPVEPHTPAAERNNIVDWLSADDDLDLDLDPARLSLRLRVTAP